MSAACVVLAAVVAGGACCIHGGDASVGRRSDTNPNLNFTFFSSLEGYQVGAKPAPASRYPWVARVVHSREQDIPHMCTAVCVQKQIFITAARCIYSLKVNHTTILYKSSRHRVRAFVVPSSGTKQAFDDIGLVVVEPGLQGAWPAVQLFDKNRTDDGFKWFADLSYGGFEYTVIGYATRKGLHRIKAPERVFDLTELPVSVSINICHSILTFNHQIDGFYVPCYHSCNVQEFKYQNPKCKNYHGVEGGALIETTTNKLLGIATWGPYFHKYELPVGFSVPNSANFFEDYECARRIRNDNGILVSVGYYQSLCSDNSDQIENHLRVRTTLASV